VMAPAQLVDAKDLRPELQPPSAARPEIAPRAAAPDAEASLVARADGAAHGAGPVKVAPLAATGDGARAAADEPGWLGGLEQRARELLRSGEPMVWDTLTREFEAQLIRSALEMTRGRRIEAAHKLGIGRNTITRKIQELGLDDK